MTASQLTALRELASILEDDKPALAQAVRSAVSDVERLTEALREERTTRFERWARSATPIWNAQKIPTSSPEFDAWYYGLGRIHPCAEFEEDADQFVLGDLVEAFKAGRDSRLRPAPVAARFPDDFGPGSLHAEARDFAPVAVEVPEYAWPVVVDEKPLKGREAYLYCRGWKDMASKLKPIDSSRILKDGERAVPVEVLEPDVVIVRSQGYTTIWWTSTPNNPRSAEALKRHLRDNPGAVREDLWRRPPSRILKDGGWRGERIAPR